MSRVPLLLAGVGLLLLPGCNHRLGSPRDLASPAAPRGLYSVTGDRSVFLHWLANTEADVAGYRVYEAPCASGGDCPYDLVGVTGGTSFAVEGLDNGVTRYFAVAAYDRAGNEGDLSYETVFDTPRPEGINRALNNYLDTPAGSGYDFSAAAARAYDHPETDMFFGYQSSVFQMFVPDFATDIQDAGYASSLDAVDYAPSRGWSPTGTVELIVGHCYVVWTRDDHYAKFRVTSLDSSQVIFDWAYQVDQGNPELRAQRARDENSGRRTIRWDG